MDKAKIKFLLTLGVVFLLVFSWGLFFTSGFNFFWEDFSCYHLDKEAYPVIYHKPSLYESLPKIGAGYINNFFTLNRLFQIGFAPGFKDAPYAHLNWEILSTIFGDKVILYRLFNSAIFALNACFIFLIVKRISLCFSFLAILLYITAPEVWSAFLYNSDPGIYAQCGITASMLLFLNLSEKNKLNRWHIWFSYIPIIVLSNFSVLTKHDGRYLALILLPTVLIFYRDSFLFHLPALLILLFLEVPVLGILKKFFINFNFAPIALVTHNPLPLPEALIMMLKNYRFPLNALGVLPLVVLVLSVIYHVLIIIFRNRITNTSVVNYHGAKLTDKVFLFFMWFVASFAMTGLARNFAYHDFYDLQMLDMLFFIPPFIIFLSYYVFWVYRRLNNFHRRVLFKAAVILLSIHVVFVNFIRLNKFRIGWGSYYCGWQNAEEYIDNVSDNALALAVNVMVYKPFIFLHSKNRVLVSEPPLIPSPFCDLQYIEKQFKQGNYKDIFVVGRGKLLFSGSSNNVSLVGIKAFEGNCGSLYDYIIREKGLLERLKRIFRPQMKNTYLYHFQWRHNDRL